jgi:2Fe-2S ferredoxin
MTRITFVTHDGRAKTVNARDGDSVMRSAMADDVEGIVAECGGSTMCATCHCYVDDAWVDLTGARKDGEDEMLDSAISEIRPNSRLSCQITVTPALDGLVVHLPPAQL